MLFITHDRSGGTLIGGTSRGDGTNLALKACGWRWSGQLGSWYLPRSRDCAANIAVIDHTVRALAAAGLQVTVTIHDDARPTSAIEADRIERQAERADRLATSAAKLAADAADADRAAHEIADRVPLGQPVLIGHHSESRMRRHYDTVHNAQRRAVDLGDRADDAATAAAAASITTGGRYNPVTVAARIERLEADVRATDRALDGYTRTYHVDRDGTRHDENFPAASGEHRGQLTTRRAELADQLTYWQQIHAEQLADSTAAAYRPDTITKGDAVRIRGTWYEVVRVNRKTVTVPSTLGSWTDTSPYREIQDHRPA